MKNSIFPYYGGKFTLAKKFIEWMPPHNVFVDVFGGAANVILQKPPYGVEVYNDINSDLVNLFRVLRDETKFNEFYKRLNLLLYSREEYNYYRKLETEDEIEKALSTYVTYNQSFSGVGVSWSYFNKFTRQATRVIKYLKCIENLNEIVSRFKLIQIENDDFRNILPRYDSKDALFYLDPPYVHDTRQVDYGYAHEIEDKDHVDMLELVIKLKGKAMISGYDSELYRKYLDNNDAWRKIEFSCHTTCSNFSDDTSRKEILYIKDNGESNILFTNIMLNDMMEDSLEKTERKERERN